MDSRDWLNHLITAEKGATPPAQLQVSGWARLRAADLSQALVPAATGAPLGAGSLVLAGKGLVIGVGIGMAALGGATATGLLDENGGAQKAPTHAVATAQTPTVASPRVAVLPTPPTEPVTVSAAPPESTPATSAGSPSAAVGAAPLEAELLLLKQAKAALDAGQLAPAEVWLQEHASQYPGGALASERDGLFVVLNCLKSPGTDTQRYAARFLAGHQDNLLAQRIERACQLSGSTRGRH
jgi:hypothetical protein